MRTIEIRRHSYTKKGAARGKGSHLSQIGVDLAQTVGETLGPYDLVVTSCVPRTVETALAMGFAVDDQIEALGDIPPDVPEEIGRHERWSWERPFVEFARLIGQGGPTARLGQRQVQAWTEALESVPPGGSVLLISHGWVIESGLAVAVAQADFLSWAAPCWRSGWRTTSG